jgi:hypothetical protein
MDRRGQGRTASDGGDTNKPILKKAKIVVSSTVQSDEYRAGSFGDPLARRQE